MTEFIFSYGLFLAKVVTGLIALVIVVGIIGGARNRGDEQAKLKLTNLNKKHDQIKSGMLATLMDKKEFKAHSKEQEQAAKKEKKSSKVKTETPRLFVLEFDGDINASETRTLRDEVSAILSIAQPQDEVLLKLDNSGGVVHGHGLAASQLERIKSAKLTLTVAVDKVAASGGYLMACVADKIIAAPFAIIGSIGVIAQLPNFNRLLDRAGIDFEQHTAGEFKRTLTMFGENKDSQREKFKEELQEVHGLFRDFVSSNRPKLDIDSVATGEHWYGKQALEKNLVDELMTSDEFIINALDQFQVYEVEQEEQKTLQDRLLGGLFSSVEGVRQGLSKFQQDAKYK